MKKVLNFVKGKRDDKGPSKMNPQISVEITNPSGQKIPSDDEHIMGLQQGFGYSVDVSGKDKSMLKIHKASWFGNLDKLKLCAKKTDINTPDSLNRTCLHLAVAQGHTEVAWYLLNNNASITACDSDGLTPFLKAIECGQKDCTNLLIECGVDVNTADGDGNTGLHIASRSGFYNIASLLLKEGANLNVPNNSGNYPLHMATSCDHKDIVELLIKYGANVQVLDRERRTSLMLAARNGLSSIIKVLLENGALLETADSNGWTAEDYAQFGGHQDLMELLETKKKEVSFDQSDKLSVQSSDQSEHVAFEGTKTAVTGSGETADSPRSCIIPPALEPPRSWDLLQSGVMDQEGSLESRKSLLTLGNLKKGYETGSCELIVSPADNAPSSLSPSGDFPSDMRLSPEPLSLAPTPERRTRSPLERGHSFDMPSDNDSPLQGLSAEELNSMCKQPGSTQLLNDEDNVEPNNVSKINNNILNGSVGLEKQATIIINQGAFTEGNVNLYNEKNVSNVIDNPRPKSDVFADRMVLNDGTYTMESSASYDGLDERSYCTDNQHTGVSSSLDNIDYDNGKSLSIEIIQSTGNLDDTLSITTTKNIFRECHSLELLEAEVGDSRSYKNSKRHHRNKSITITGQPLLWKSAGTLPKTHSFERGSIDAQLMCYDEALRQLAKVKKSTDAKDAQSNTSPVLDLKLNKSSKSLDHVEMKSVDSSPESFQGRSTEFRTPIDDDLEYLDRDNNFPPPPIHFLENEDGELCQLDCDDKSLQIDVLPMPISMLTPIKETQIECDSLSIAEPFDNEHSLSERSNIRSDGTPNHFNVEVIVNSNTPEASQSFDDAIVPEAPETSETTLQLIDDVFIEDPTLAEPYDRYFVDLKALEMVPSAVDFNKIVFPADSPSPKKGIKNYSSKTSSKFPSLHFVIGGICNVNCNKPASDLYKSDSESECLGKPLRKKRKLLLAMRATGVGGSKDTNNDIDEDDIDDEDGESEEDDPPFWQNTEKGGFFIRQDTIVAKEAESHFFTRPEIEAVPTTSFGKPAVRRSCCSPLQNSEAETASASDTPRLSPMGAKDPALAHLCEASLANGLLQEKAAALMDNTARLKYELEDARQAEAVRVDTISILQSQLSRLEAQYAEAQEEVCTLKQKADCAELELKHLRELCACLSRDRNDRPTSSVKQLVDQATASTPTEDDYRQIHMQIMIKHLEDSKKLEEDKNHQLVRHLEEVLMTNQNMISEKEALIAQNIADVRKLQEDTLCWKDRYEELAAKLELLDKRLDPRLIEAQDTIATLKRTIAILQQEKSHSRRRLSRCRGPLPDSVASKGLTTLGYDEDCIEDILRILKTAYGGPKKLNMYKVTVKGTNVDSSKLSDTSDSDDVTGSSTSPTDEQECDEKDGVIKLYKSSYPSVESQRIATSSDEQGEVSSHIAKSFDETGQSVRADSKPDHQNGERNTGNRTDKDPNQEYISRSKEHPVCDDSDKPAISNGKRPSSLKHGSSICNSYDKKRTISIKIEEEDLNSTEVSDKEIGVIHKIRIQSDNTKTKPRGSSKELGPCTPLETVCEPYLNRKRMDSLPTAKRLTRDQSSIRIDLGDLNDDDRRSGLQSNQSSRSGGASEYSSTAGSPQHYPSPPEQTNGILEDLSAGQGPKRLTTTSNTSGVVGVLVKENQDPSTRRSKSKSVVISNHRSVQTISSDRSADGQEDNIDDSPGNKAVHKEADSRTNLDQKNRKVGRRKSDENLSETNNNLVGKERRPDAEKSLSPQVQGTSRNEGNSKDNEHRSSKNESERLTQKRSNSSKTGSESTTSKSDVGTPFGVNSSANKSSTNSKNEEPSKISSHDSTGTSKSGSRNRALSVIKPIADSDGQFQSSGDDSGVEQQVFDRIRKSAVGTSSGSATNGKKGAVSDGSSDKKRSADSPPLVKEPKSGIMKNNLHQQSVPEIVERNVEELGPPYRTQEKSTKQYDSQSTEDTNSHISSSSSYTIGAGKRALPAMKNSSEKIESFEEDSGIQQKVLLDRVIEGAIETSESARKGKQLKNASIVGSKDSKISAGGGRGTKGSSVEGDVHPHQQSLPEVVDRNVEELGAPNKTKGKSTMKDDNQLTDDPNIAFSRISSGSSHTSGTGKRSLPVMENNSGKIESSEEDSGIQQKVLGRVTGSSVETIIGSAGKGKQLKIVGSKDSKTSAGGGRGTKGSSIGGDVHPHQQSVPEVVERNVGELGTPNKTKGKSTKKDNNQSTEDPNIAFSRISSGSSHTTGTGKRSLPVMENNSEKIESSEEDSGIQQKVLDRVTGSSVETIIGSAGKGKQSNNASVLRPQDSKISSGDGRGTKRSSIEGDVHPHQQSLPEVVERNVGELGTPNKTKGKSTKKDNNQSTEDPNIAFSRISSGSSNTSGTGKRSLPVMENNSEKIESSEEDSGIQQKVLDRVTGSSLETSGESAGKDKQLSASLVGSKDSKISAGDDKGAKSSSIEGYVQPHQQSVKGSASVTKSTDRLGASNKEKQMVADSATVTGGLAVPLKEYSYNINDKLEPSKEVSGVQQQMSHQSRETPDDANSKSAVNGKNASPSEVGVGSGTKTNEAEAKDPKLTTTDSDANQHSKSSIRRTLAQGSAENKVDVPNPPNQKRTGNSGYSSAENITMVKVPYVSAETHKSEETTNPLIALVESRKFNSDGSQVSGKILSDIANEPVVLSSAKSNEPFDSSEPLPINQQDQLPEGNGSTANVIGSTVSKVKAPKSSSAIPQINGGPGTDHNREEIVGTSLASVANSAMTRLENAKVQSGVDENTAAQQVGSSYIKDKPNDVPPETPKVNNAKDQVVENSGDMFLIKDGNQDRSHVKDPEYNHDVKMFEKSSYIGSTVALGDQEGIHRSQDRLPKETAVSVDGGVSGDDRTGATFSNKHEVLKSDLSENKIKASPDKSVDSSTEKPNPFRVNNEYLDNNKASLIPKPPTDDLVLKSPDTSKSTNESLPSQPKVFVPKLSEMKLQGMVNGQQSTDNADGSASDKGGTLKSMEDLRNKRDVNVSPMTKANNVFQTPKDIAPPMGDKSTVSDKVISAEDATISLLQSKPVGAVESIAAIRKSPDALSEPILSTTSLSAIASAARDRFNASRGLSGSPLSSKGKSVDSQATIQKSEDIEEISDVPGYDHVGVKFSKKRQSYSYIRANSSMIQDPLSPIVQGENGSQRKLISQVESLPGGAKKERDMSVNVLPTIKEEVDEDHPLYVRQRESPAEYKKSTRASKGSSLSRRSSLSYMSFMEYGSDEEENEEKRPFNDDEAVTHSRHAHKHAISDEPCNCRSICNCCTCGKNNDPKHSSPVKVEKHHPDEHRRKTLGKEGPFDYSTPPFPKDSMKVLSSPFFAHWAYYDVDQDHPVAKYLKRAEHTALDTECIIMKNYKLADLCIPYLNITARKKITSKLVCNYYKKRSLLSKKRGAQVRHETEKGGDASHTPDCSLSPAPQDAGSAKVKSCHCKKTHALKSGEDGDIWEGHVDPEDEFVVPMELKRREEAEQNKALEAPSKLVSQFCCDLGTDCDCVQLPEFTRNQQPLLLPTTPCQSCECFIDDVASEPSTQSVFMHGSITTAVSFEDSDSSKNLGVGDYFNNLQDLVVQLYGMIGKMKNVVEDTNSGSTPDKAGSGSLKSKKRSSS